MSIELTDKAKQVKREYQKVWRANNKDKIKQYQAKYWNKRANEAKEL